MAKDKQSKTKKPSGVASTAKIPSEKPSLVVKKSSGDACTSKNPVKDVTTAKKKKQPEPVKIPVPESSSEEDEELESEEEQEEPSKDSGKNPVTPSASAPVVSATANQSSVSESESESDSETEPASTKTSPPAVSASQNKKRLSEGAAASTEVNASKLPKTESSGTGSEKKGLFQRIWSEEDEIVLLQGIIDFRRNTGKHHSDDLSGFYETVKNSISVDVKNMHQFSSKIWSLRKKYVAKRKSGGEPSFTKSHDQRCLELAKMVWDADYTALKSKKTIEVEDDSLENDDADWFERSFVVGEITSLSAFVDGAYVREKWSLVPVKAKKMMLEKWKSLEATKLKCALQKADLVNEVSHWISKSV